ncbi:uncharacterized protein tbc1d10c [Diretmus argenteus]
MLNPSGPAQKKPREEDSSGSDAGSEVSLEPVATETDRFGFILANGSTAGCVGPPPQLVRQREAKWINIISQWDCMLLKKTSKVKEQCQKGIPASLRAKCWPLLCGASDRMKHNEDLYRSLDSRPAVQSWVDVIERDLDRQFPFHEMFLSRDGHGQRGLFRVLKAYTQYQPEEGYCQAQGPVAAVLLMNMPAEEAFWCLVQISEQYLPGYYSPLLEGVLFDAAMLTWVLKRACPAAHRHLQRHGVEPLMFATDWLMCLFTRHLPFNTLLRVWDLFFCYGVRVLFQVAVVLVRRVLGRAEQRQECQGQMETLERLRGVREQVQQEDDTFIAEVCSVPLSGRDLERRTEKELEKWRKDRPSSTFDPRGRCHGYRMAWARAREKEEEQDRTERARGNLSLPLVRSVSTLSLSPSLLQKRWRIGAKVNAGEREGGNRVQRNFSMGAREKGWDSWTDRNLKKVQPVEEEEDKVSEEVKKQSRPKPTGRVERNELLREPEGPVEKQNAPIQRLEERETPKEQAIERVEPRKAEIEANQPGETEESRGSVKVPDRQTEHSVEEDRTAETERNESPAEARCAGDAAHHRDHIQGEELDSNSQSQVLEQQIHNNQETAEDTETTDPVTPPEKSQASTQPAKQDSAAEPDGKTISLQTVSSDHPAPKQPESQVTVGPEEEKNRVEGADDAFLSSPNQSGSSNISQSVNKEECCTVDSPCVVSDPQLENKGDSHLAEKSSPDPMQACGYRIRASSDDFRVRKSSSSRGSRLARRLSEDLFTAPRSQTQSNPGSTNSDQTNLDTAQSGAPQPDQEPAPSSSREETGSTQGTGAKPEQRPPDAPKRFGLFRRLRGEQPKQTMQVPKILIQDFSDGVGKASPIEEESEEKLSSRERRRRRRRLSDA